MLQIGVSRQMAYTIQKKDELVFYIMVAVQGDPTIIRKFELEFRRDEKVMRILLTTVFG